MKKLNFAIQESEKILVQYKGMKNIIFDKWRGWRYIFDCEAVEKCNNNCLKCDLYIFLQANAKIFKYARLIESVPNDKQLFGPENYLNCKSLANYQQCYINFILRQTKTKSEIEAELNLLFNMRILYTSDTRITEAEQTFKQAVISSVLAKCSKGKKQIIEDYLLKNGLDLIFNKI